MHSAYVADYRYKALAIILEWKGVDGRHYEFSSQFYKEKKGAIGWDEDVCYFLRNGRKVLVKGFYTPYECISDVLVRQITGRDVKKNGFEWADIFK